jgi:hypothetical protein
VTQARLERNAALQPLQTQGAQIQANEQGAQAAYAKLQGSENEQLQKLGAQQEASAKTLQNQMAENALQQGKAIETTGQTQASMTGGYVSPELRSQLLSQSQLAGQTGGAGNQFAQNLAQAGATNLAEMRGSASLKALGGSQNLTNFFQKQQQGVQQNEQGVLAKVAPRALEIEGNLGKEQFTRKATAGALELKNLLGKGAINARENASKRTRATGAENAAARRKANEIGEEEGPSKRAQREADTNLKKYQLEHPKAASSKGLTVHETNGYISSLLGGYTKVSEYRTGAGKRAKSGKEGPAQRAKSYAGLRRAIESGEHPEKYTTPEGEAKVRMVKEGKRNPTVVTAAIELYNTHKVSQSTRQALRNLGIELPDDKSLFNMVRG